jgi:hypothetical protein
MSKRAPSSWRMRRESGTPGAALAAGTTTARPGRPTGPAGSLADSVQRNAALAPILYNAVRRCLRNRAATSDSLDGECGGSGRRVQPRPAPAARARVLTHDAPARSRPSRRVARSEAATGAPPSRTRASSSRRVRRARASPVHSARTAPASDSVSRVSFPSPTRVAS